MTHDPLSPNNPGSPGNPYSEPANPYAPSGEVGTPIPGADPSDFEAYRKAHLSHEASVKSIGCLYYFGAVFGVLLGLVYMGAALAGGLNDRAEVPVAVLVGLGVFMLGMGIAQGYIGYGLRHLKPWARIGGIVLSVIGLLGVPIGTLVSGYFLYLLASHKGEVVFSDDYRHVIGQTPHIKYKTSIIVKILVVVLVVVLTLGIVAVVLSG